VKKPRYSIDWSSITMKDEMAEVTLMEMELVETKKNTERLEDEINKLKVQFLYQIACHMTCDTSHDLRYIT